MRHHRTTPTSGRHAALRHAALHLAGAALIAVGALAPVSAIAQTTGGTAVPAAGAGSEAGREGAADPESVRITLSSQAAEIRQILLEGGETGADGLDAAVRAREVVSQAIEATGILGNPGDTQVTTTRMSAMDTANAQFERMAEALDIRIAAIRAGDASAANQARLDVLDAINELPEDIRMEGDAAPSDNFTVEPGGAQPTLQQ